MRYLLYIDILGFSDLVAGKADKVADLYEVIASLNVHRHPTFKAIVFSDTLLVYNITGGDTPAEARYVVMFLSEFAQDLQHRLTQRGIVFRAVIVRGNFRHYELNGIPCFFGSALVDAYQSEKPIKAIGLFIDRTIEKASHIFKTTAYNDRFSFVFITQSIDKLEYTFGGRFPIDRFELQETDLIWMLTPELLYLRQLHLQMQFHPIDAVRVKYANTWALYSAQYPKTTQHLVNSNFDLERVCPGASWDKVLARFPQSYSFAVETRREY